MADLLAHIRATPWLADLLATQFDFDLTRDDPVEQVHLANGQPLTPVAGDGAGGTFLLTPAGAVVYAGSEGEGGLIAANLRDALALVVGLPSLHDALARPLGDELRVSSSPLQPRDHKTRRWLIEHGRSMEAVDEWSAIRAARSADGRPAGAVRSG